MKAKYDAKLITKKIVYDKMILTHMAFSLLVKCVVKFYTIPWNVPWLLRIYFP